MYFHAFHTIDASWMPRFEACLGQGCAAEQWAAAAHVVRCGGHCPVAIPPMNVSDRPLIWTPGDRFVQPNASVLTRGRVEVRTTTMVHGVYACVVTRHRPARNRCDAGYLQAIDGHAQDV